MFTNSIAVLTALLGASSVLAFQPGTPTRFARRACTSSAPSAPVVTPKIMIVSMFSYERAGWIEPYGLTYNVSPQVVGLSPIYPDVACNHAGSMCIMTTGEAEINAASTIMALTLSTQFDFRLTYWLIAGIAGINPYLGTLGSAAFARFSIQVALEYEIDARQMPANWTTGYWALGTAMPGQVPKTSDLYGTEVFELNTVLKEKAVLLAAGVKMNDSATAVTYRANFDYAPANQPPSVIECDVATSDVYYAGTLLSESFGNYSSYMTGGQAKYCMTAQEDNATLESMVRAHKGGLVDYSRIVLLRSGSDFDRAPPTITDAYTAFEANQGGFEPALQNLIIAGSPFVNDVLANWSSYVGGVGTQDIGEGSYYGDDLGTIRDGAALAR